jgi:hypothetical protein
MDGLDPFEPGTHVFTGTIKRCDVSYAELLTDSGFAVPLATHGGPPVRAGAHVTVVARKYRPCYFVIALSKV